MARIEMTGAEMAPCPQPPASEAYFQLGIDHSTGREGQPDLVAAHKWFNLAAMQGNAEAARYRQEIAREMSPSAIAAAQRAAREWLRAH